MIIGLRIRPQVWLVFLFIFVNMSAATAQLSKNAVAVNVTIPVSGTVKASQTQNVISHADSNSLASYSFEYLQQIKPRINWFAGIDFLSGTYGYKDYFDVGEIYFGVNSTTAYSGVQYDLWRGLFVGLAGDLAYVKFESLTKGYQQSLLPGIDLFAGYQWELNRRLGFDLSLQRRTIIDVEHRLNISPAWVLTGAGVNVSLQYKL